METLPPSTPSVNEVPSTTNIGPAAPAVTDGKPFLPEDQPFLARIAVVEGHAMAVAVADAVAELPRSAEVERIQALANVCQRTCKRALEAMDRLMTEQPAT